MSTNPPSFDQWVPGADKATHQVAQPFGYTLVNTARIQNLTAGQLFVRRGQDTAAGPGSFDWIVPAYSSENIPLSDVGLTYYWTGLPTTDDKVVTAFSGQETGPSGSTVGAPVRARFFETHTLAISDGGLGGSPTVNSFGGGTIMSALIENSSGWHIQVHAGGAAGQVMGTLPPFSSRALKIGASAMTLLTVPAAPGAIHKASGVVRYTLSDVIEADNGLLPYDDQNHQPAGSQLQVVASGDFVGGGFPKQIAQIAPTEAWVLHHLELDLITTKSSAGAVTSWAQIGLSNGIDGASAALPLVTATTLVDGSAPGGGLGRGRGTFRGPLQIAASQFGPNNYFQITASSGAGLTGFYGSYSLHAWKLAFVP